MNSRGIVMGRKSAQKQECAHAMRREMTDAEAALWEQLRRNRCGGLHFRRQQVIDGFIADFYCHAAGLVIEVDGGIHENQSDYDAMRDSIITAHGLRVVRFKHERILNDLTAVLAEIQTAAQQHYRPTSQ
jgi:very-short-patch-repair endonuclease